ncbi:hypothetical protein [Nocardia callitridis]|uniref:hypothetical protein n=1 Tax=Nocardia callitridis TaxID=648753 RepID=UPI0031E73EC1
MAPTGPEALFTHDEVEAMVAVLKALRTTAVQADLSDRVVTRARPSAGPMTEGDNATAAAGYEYS